MHELIPLFPDRDHLYVRELIIKALGCPVCKSANQKLKAVATASLRPQYAVLCTGCNNIGPFGKTLKQAIHQWNKCVPGKSFFRKWFRK